jgi:hypothetical protein
MKTSLKLAIGSILATGAVFSSSHIAQAGGGVAGSAGSISAEFTTGNALSATAGAVAVGKAGAITTATGSTTDITASAVGYAGALTVVDFNTVDVEYEVARETAANLARLQGNIFNGASKSGTSLLPGANTGVSLQ